MKLVQLETFIKVVEANSLVSAAKQLGVSPAAVSKQISALENALKVILLQRTTRRLGLTELGRIYYEHSKNLLKKAVELDEAVASLHAEPSGSLTVLSSRYFADYYIIPHLEEFFAKYPKINLDLIIAGRSSDFSREDIDLFFGIAHRGPADAVEKEIMKGHFSLCTAPSYIKKYGMPHSPQELQQHRFITYSVRESCHRLSFNNGVELYLNPLLKVSDTKIMITCALQGLGFVKLHSLESEKYLSNGTLVEILADFREPPQPIYLCYQQHRYLQPKVRLFIKFFIEKIGIYESQNFCRTA
jgi:DNA-binding transcriptional LysR family regulator